MVVITVIGALALLVPVAVADSRVPDNSTSVGPLKVRVYSQMCDGLGGAKLHTRLNVKNVSGKAQKVTVVDAFAKVVYDPPGPIAPGKGTLVHLTSSRQTPAHTVTVLADGASAPVSIAKSPCPPPTTVPTTKPPPTSEPTTNPTTATTSPYVPPTVPQGPTGGGPVGSPGVVGANGVVSDPGGGTSAAKAASGTLPFTGSDIRGFALIGDLMVLIGFALLLASHRSPRMTALLKRLTPKRLALHRAT